MVRRLGVASVALAAAAVGAIALATPAMADVRVVPSEAAPGGPAELAFQLPEERPGAHTTKVEIQAPTETPIAEVYPMSTNEWAPQITTRLLDQPLTSIHGGRTTEVVSSITWTRVGKFASPAKPALLRISAGPMPEADRVVFNLIQTYSDGTVVRWTDPPAADGKTPKHPAPVITLTGKAPAGAVHGGGSAHGGSTDSGQAHADAAQPKAAAGEDGMFGTLGAGLLVGLALGLVGSLIVIMRSRRTSTAASRAARREVLGQQ